MTKTMAVCFIAVALSGCVTYAPPVPVRLSAAVTAATPPGEGAVKLFGSSTWRPDTIGFANAGQRMMTDGMLVLTDKGVLWEQWDKRACKLSIAKKIRYADIHVVALAESGPDRLIVIQSKNYQHDSFALTQDSAPIADPEKTAAGYRMLLNLLFMR
ncbi:MAG: hypothetical protein JWQ21_4126 [Herminiimonas sp.]|nr:hypothetical protein [Herminiimonas sp.]